MDDGFKFEHELNPEGRSRASLGVERQRMAEELHTARSNLVRLVVGLGAAGGLWWLIVTVTSYRIYRIVPALVLLATGCGVISVAIAIRNLIKARRRLREWDETIEDCHSVMSDCHSQPSDGALDGTVR